MQYKIIKSIALDELNLIDPLKLLDDFEGIQKALQ